MPVNLETTPVERLRTKSGVPVLSVDPRDRQGDYLVHFDRPVKRSDRDTAPINKYYFRSDGTIAGPLDGVDYTITLVETPVLAPARAPTRVLDLRTVDLATTPLRTKCGAKVLRIIPGRVRRDLVRVEFDRPVLATHSERQTSWWYQHNGQWDGGPYDMQANIVFDEPPIDPRLQDLITIATHTSDVKFAILKAFELGKESAA